MNEFLRQPCSFVQKRSWTVDIVAFFASICSRRLVSFSLALAPALGLADHGGEW